jgi:hypothetical protein
VNTYAGWSVADDRRLLDEPPSDPPTTRTYPFGVPILV